MLILSDVWYFPEITRNSLSLRQFEAKESSWSDEMELRFWDKEARCSLASGGLGFYICSEHTSGPEPDQKCWEYLWCHISPMGPRASSQWARSSLQGFGSYFVTRAFSSRINYAIYSVPILGNQSIVAAQRRHLQAFHRCEDSRSVAMSNKGWRLD